MTTKENDFENDDVSGLLASMKRVEAPGDFDVRVRARIAQGRPATMRSWFPLPARITAIVLVMLTTGYFGFRSYQSNGVNEASLAPVQVTDQVLAERKEEPTSRELIQPAFTEEANKVVSAPKDVDPGIVTGTPNDKEAQKRKDNKGGGSVDVALGESKPRGPRVSTKESLSAIGIETDPSGTVSEVKQNTVAERSGLKAGDVIVKVTASSIRVKRDGKVVDVPRKP